MGKPQRPRPPLTARACGRPRRWASTWSTWPRQRPARGTRQRSTDTWWSSAAAPTRSGPPAETGAGQKRHLARPRFELLHPARVVAPAVV